MCCPPSHIKLWTFHVSTEVRYRDPITRSGQLGLRENQLDHSSAGMCYRAHICMGAWIEIEVRGKAGGTVWITPRGCMDCNCNNLGSTWRGGLVFRSYPRGAWIEIRMKVLRRSQRDDTPHMVCGLKFQAS